MSQTRLKTAVGGEKRNKFVNNNIGERPEANRAHFLHLIHSRRTIPPGVLVGKLLQRG